MVVLMCEHCLVTTVLGMISGRLQYMPQPEDPFNNMLWLTYKAGNFLYTVSFDSAKCNNTLFNTHSCLSCKPLITEWTTHTWHTTTHHSVNITSHNTTICRVALILGCSLLVSDVSITSYGGRVLYIYVCVCVCVCVRAHTQCSYTFFDI